MKAWILRQGYLQRVFHSLLCIYFYGPILYMVSSLFTLKLFEDDNDFLIHFSIDGCRDHCDEQSYNAILTQHEIARDLE